MTEQRRPAGDGAFDGRVDKPGVPDKLEELIILAKAFVALEKRRFLGITGAPGSGKSTLAEVLVVGLGRDAVQVGMDGFHLANEELRRLDRHPRKGPPDTFDAGECANLFRRPSSSSRTNAGTRNPVRMFGWTGSLPATSLSGGLQKKP